MQKENPVIKNYIMSSKTLVLADKNTCKTTETYLYHLPLKQNKGGFCLFLLRK